MKKIVFIAAILCTALTTFSQVEIKLEDVNRHVGDSVKVCGKVYGGIYLDRSNGTPTFLNVGVSYPNNPLTIVIWADVRKSFEAKPEEFYKDKEICVTGKIELYRDKPQIVLKDASLLIIKK